MWNCGVFTLEVRNSMEFQSYLFMNEKLTGIQQNADKYYWIFAEFEMVLVKVLCGIKIPRNSSSVFDNIGIPVEFPRNSGPWNSISLHAASISSSVVMLCIETPVGL